MAHLGPEVVRQASRGPAALAGAVIGFIAVMAVGLFFAAPSGCGPSEIQITEQGLGFYCANLPKSGFLPTLHSIPWLALFGAPLVGAVLAAYAAGEKE